MSQQLVSNGAEGSGSNVIQPQGFKALSMAQALLRRGKMWLSGISHDGARDLYATFGYNRCPEHKDYVAKYYRQGIARRIVNAPVLGTWSDPPSLTADGEDFNQIWQEIAQTTKLFHNIIRLDKLAGLGKFAVLVVGFDDGRGLDTPITPLSEAPTFKGKRRKILYLQAYAEGAIEISEWENNKNNWRFGLPTMYTIHPGRFQVEGTSASPAAVSPNKGRTPFRVHWSRLVHVAENLLEDNVYGSSRLEPVNNDLDDNLKISGGSAELFWILGNRGIQVDVDKEIDLDPEAAKDLAKEVEEYQHELRRFIRTRGVKINNLGSDPVDPRGTYEVNIMNISAATGIPQMVLMGSAVGHLSSQQDRAGWAERIAERITEYAQPIVLKGILDCFIFAGALPIPQNLQIDWPEAFKLSPLERAQTSAQMARSAANLTKAAANMGGGVDEDGDGQPDSQQQQVDEDGNPIQQDDQQQQQQQVDADGNPIEGDPKAQGNLTAKKPKKKGKPLFSHEEMRRMVSFGKHPPVFDNPQPIGQVGDGEAPASNTNVPKNTKG